MTEYYSNLRVMYNQTGNGGIMISNQWYAILSSSDLKSNKVTGVLRFGENLIMFRNADNKVVCLNSVCAHRGASLEKGWLANHCIKCPFHGIEYDSDGKCVYVPSDGKASVEDYAKFHLKSFPTREIGGIIFVWYGDAEPTTEPDYFDVILDESYTYDHMEDFWHVHYSRVIENQLDVSHLAFVHHNTIGRGNRTLCNGPKVVWLDDNTLQTSANNEVDFGQIPKSSDESTIKSTNLNFKFPNMWLNHVSDRIQILAFFIPVDEENSIIALRFYNKITGFKAIDKMIAWIGSKANKLIERQDKRIVETQLPKASELYMEERLVQADIPIIQYRTKRHELKKRQEGRTSVSSKRKQQNVKVGTTMDTKAMYKLSYGLYVCTVIDGDKINGCIINTAIQVASEPNRISIAINKANLTRDMVLKTGECNISVISNDATFELFKHFGFQSGRDTDKFAEYPKINYSFAENGIPYITAGTNAYFSLRVEQSVDLGSHTLFICEPIFMTVLSTTCSCTYEYYQNNIKPKPEAVGMMPNGETIWRCRICGYEYVGEEVPDDFICPICKHPKADFEKL